MTDCWFACMKFIYLMDTDSATRCWLHEYGANVKMTDCRFAWMKFTCQADSVSLRTRAVDSVERQKDKKRRQDKWTSWQKVQKDKWTNWQKEAKRQVNLSACGPGLYRDLKNTQGDFHKEKYTRINTKGGIHKEKYTRRNSKAHLSAWGPGL